VDGKTSKQCSTNFDVIYVGIVVGIKLIVGTGMDGRGL
jgi:hypothetical protein